MERILLEDKDSLPQWSLALVMVVMTMMMMVMMVMMVMLKMMIIWMKMVIITF